MFYIEDISKCMAHKSYIETTHRYDSLDLDSRSGSCQLGQYPWQAFQYSLQVLAIISCTNNSLKFHKSEVHNTGGTVAYEGNGSLQLEPQANTQDAEALIHRLMDLQIASQQSTLNPLLTQKT